MTACPYPRVGTGRPTRWRFAPPLALVRGTFRGAPIPKPAVTEAKAGRPDDRDPEPKQQEQGSKLPAIGGTSRPDFLLPGAGPVQPAPSTKGADDVSLAMPKSNSEPSKGAGANAFRGDHWRGMRKPKPRSETTSVGS